jgi:hypothetical protein
MKTVDIEMSDEAYEALKDIADFMQMSMDELIVMLALREIEKDRKSKTQKEKP